MLLLSCGCSVLYDLNATQCQSSSDCAALGVQFANTSCVDQVCVSNRSLGLSGSTGGSVSAAAGNAGASLGGAISSAGSGGSSAQAGASGGGGSGGGATATQLALGKPVIASSEQSSALAVQGNDGDQTSLWCAKDGTFPQWWRVDLGANHTLDSFAVTWGHPDRTYSYKVETSTNDRVYSLQATVSGIGTQQSVSFPAPVSARYVRITVTDAESGTSATGTSYTTFACFYEFTVQGS
jgi:hypothetical protein